MHYDFVTKVSKYINTGQSRSIILSGNIDDLFWDEENYVPLVPFLSKKYTLNRDPSSNTRGLIQVIYEVNKQIVIKGAGAAELRAVWNRIKPSDDLDDLIKSSFSNATLAMELLRQLTVISRTAMVNSYDLLIIIERADLLLPEAEISRMNYADRKRCAIVHDWFSDPDFCNSNDSVIMITESRSQLHSLVSKLPQVLEVEIPSPDIGHRKFFILQNHSEPKDAANLAVQTAGLSIHALRQLLCEDEICTQKINDKVEEYICSQLGEDVVEFKRPQHTLDDVIGFTKVKSFIREEMIPRFLANGDSSLSGAAIAGPIGGDKTFIMEAMASELSMPVLVLKNLRSQWYGQTDVIFERLKRTLTALDKVVIFIDEADTQFGSVGANSHDTERRLTGKIQGMMSDTKLKGKVIWLLMTARIELLSPDIRRPGRAGDLIIPILDPEGQDRDKFISWMLNGIGVPKTTNALDKIKELTKGYSAASFAALRSLIKAKKCRLLEEVELVAEDIIPSDIESERRYQTLQALMNCTRKSLLTPTCGTSGKEMSREDLMNQRQLWKDELDQIRKNEVL